MYITVCLYVYVYVLRVNPQRPKEEFGSPRIGGTIVICNCIYNVGAKIQIWVHGRAASALNH